MPRNILRGFSGGQWLVYLAIVLAILPTIGLIATWARSDLSPPKLILVIALPITAILLPLFSRGRTSTITFRFISTCLFYGSAIAFFSAFFLFIPSTVAMGGATLWAILGWKTAGSAEEHANRSSERRRETIDE